MDGFEAKKAGDVVYGAGRTILMEHNYTLKELFLFQTEEIVRSSKEHVAVTPLRELSESGQDYFKKIKKAFTPG